jgi:hypothetical protein
MFKTNHIAIACKAFHEALVGDAKLPSQHAINRDGIGLLEALADLEIARAHARIKRLEREGSEDFEYEAQKARNAAVAMKAALGFLKAQHNAVPVVSDEEAAAIEEASAAI